MFPGIPRRICHCSPILASTEKPSIKIFGLRREKKTFSNYFYVRWEKEYSGVDPIKLIFFDNEEFFHFFAAKLGHFIINTFLFM